MKIGSANNCTFQNREENSSTGLRMKQAKENLALFSCKKGSEKYQFNRRNGRGGRRLETPLWSYMDTKIKKPKNHI